MTFRMVVMGMRTALLGLVLVASSTGVATAQCCRPYLYAPPLAWAPQVSVQVVAVPQVTPSVTYQPMMPVISERRYGTPLRNALFGRWRVHYMPVQIHPQNGIESARK